MKRRARSCSISTIPPTSAGMQEGRFYAAIMTNIAICRSACSAADTSPGPAEACERRRRWRGRRSGADHCADPPNVAARARNPAGERWVLQRRGNLWVGVRRTRSTTCSVLARNPRLEAALTDKLAQASVVCMSSRQARAGIPRLPLSHGQELEPDTSRGRQGQAHTLDGSNPPLSSPRSNALVSPTMPRALYEDLYCARVKPNRIGEQFEVFADRASSATMSANQLRMSFSSNGLRAGRHFASCRPAPFPVR